MGRGRGRIISIEEDEGERRESGVATVSGVRNWVSNSGTGRKKEGAQQEEWVRGKRFRIGGAEFQGSLAGGMFAGTGSLDLERCGGFSFTFEPGPSQCQTYFPIKNALLFSQPFVRRC